jgi:hypothetical protein
MCLSIYSRFCACPEHRGESSHKWFWDCEKRFVFLLVMKSTELASNFDLQNRDENIDPPRQARELMKDLRAMIPASELFR